MGWQQAGSRTGDGSATGFGNRRVVRQAGFGNRVWQQAGSRTGEVSATGRQTGSLRTGRVELEHELAPAAWRFPA